MEKYVIELYEQLISQVKIYNPKSDLDLINRAFLFSYEAHKKVWRKSKELYIIHPLHTAINLTKIDADDASICAWLLHDVLDNKSYKINDILNNFWEEISNLVSWVVKLGDLYFTLDMNKKDIENLKKNLVLAWNDIRIFLIKIADRYHNLETLNYLQKQKRYRIARETQEIYLPIVNFLWVWEFFSQMHDLCFQYTNEDEYKKLDKIFWDTYKENKQKIIQAHNYLLKELQKEGIATINIEGRVKNLYSIYRKITKKHLNINEIYDILALRVITKNLGDAYLVLGIIHKLYKAKSDRFKDYISEPKQNWYQSIHTTVYDNEWNFIEFQIQTLEMSKLNKLWIAAHFIYKWFWIDYKNFPEWMKWFIDEKKLSFDQKLFIEKMKDEVVVWDIKCYDSEGNMYLLPKSSTLIDFAFTKSFENGSMFSGAFINSIEIDNPFYILKNDDKIILKKSNKIFLNYSIENYFQLKTDLARSGMKKIFEKHSKNKLIELWKYILDNDLETYWFRHFHANSTHIKNKIIKSFWVKNEQSLYLFIAIWSVESSKVVSKVASLYDKKIFDKKVSLKIYLKLKDFNILNNVTKIFYSLNLIIKEINYSDKKNHIIIKFEVDNSNTLDNLLSELKRIPNVLKIVRMFPFRLKMYYFLYFLAVSFLTGIIFFINIFDFSKYQKTLVLQWVLFWTSVFMVMIVFFVKHVVKTILPDLLRYKRFWLSLFLLNTYVFFIIFWEAMFLWFSLYFILYFFLTFFIYIIISYEYFKYRKYKN